MDRVFFEGIRCFASRQEVPLAPVTILVGENSSGKSTALALIRLAWDVGFRVGAPDFNEEPFVLGSHSNMVSFGESNRFAMGLCAEIKIGEELEEARVVGDFKLSDDGFSSLDRWSGSFGRYSANIQFVESESFAEMVAKVPDGQARLKIPNPVASINELMAGMMLASNEEMGARFLIESNFEHREIFSLGARVYQFGQSIGSRPYAFAPIRSRPRRTYDPVRGFETPEGSHIPAVLAGTQARDINHWRQLSKALDEFGESSGLFSHVEIRRLGASEGEPFQVLVNVGASQVNLIDVGYGVSQALPIVVDCLRGKEGGTYLLQQPEVHLHPRAQAQLGSFLAVLAKQQNKRFVIETHSDYLVDRIRMDIRDKKGITPDDVALLYFERKNGEATIHRLELDDQGNILNAPPGYRQFFLEETRRFLGD